MPVPQNRRFVTEDDLEIYVKSDSIADVVRQSEIADVVRDAEMADALAYKADTAFVQAGFIAKGSIALNVADFGAVGDGVTDDTAALQAAINAAPDWATVFAPKHTTYRTSGLSTTGKNIDLDFRNSAFVRTTTAPILDAYGTYGTPTTSGPIASQAISVTVADASGFKQGDLVKIYSDDIIPDARPGDHLDTNNPATTAWHSRKGEHAIVVSIAGNVLNINPPLYDSYDTNVRVAVMNEESVQFRFGKLDHANLAATQDMMASIRMTGCRTPVIEGKIHDAPLGAIELNGCFGAKVDVEVNRLPAGPGGYGVQSRGSVRGDIRINSHMLRHAYTDDIQWQKNAEPSANPAHYGRPMYDTITGKSVASSATSWDTHHGGVGHLFRDCLAVGNSEASGAGFSVRGQSHTFYNCAGNSLAVGFRIFDEGNFSWATSKNHRMVGCSTGMNTRQAIYIDMSNFTTPEQGPNVTISGGTFESHDGSGMRLLNARVHMMGPLFRHTKAVRPSAYNALISCGIAALSGNMHIDLSMITSTTLDAVFSFTSGTTPERTVNLDVTAVLGAWLRTAGSLTCLARMNSVKGQIRWNVDGPLAAAAIGTASLTPPEQSAIVKTTFGIGTSTPTGATASRAYNAATSFAMHNASAGDPIIKQNIHVNANSVATSIAPGAFDGQQLLIRARADNGAFTLTITDGVAALTSLGGNVVLAAGQVLRLVWDDVDDVWVKL